jgi:hypothetical protein
MSPASSAAKAARTTSIAVAIGISSCARASHGINTPPTAIPRIDTMTRHARVPRWFSRRDRPTDALVRAVTRVSGNASQHRPRTANDIRRHRRCAPPSNSEALARRSNFSGLDRATE